MRAVRAQITTRSGPPGAKDVQALMQGEFTMSGDRASREFLEVLGCCLEAARGVASDGLVTEVAVLVYPDALAGRRAQG